jgi:cob(I)alamin adenosyltransferase
MATPKVYTKKGDAGFTDLLGGRASKSQYVFAVLNQMDRLGVELGRVLQHEDERFVRDLITDIQKLLIILNSVIATVDLTSDQAKARIVKLETEAEVILAQLETDIDERTAKLPPLDNFLLAQGEPSTLDAHSARVSCREAESGLVSLDLPLPNTRATINRLSDWVFTMARWHSDHELAFQESKGTFEVQ